MTYEFQKVLDSLDDELFLAYLSLNFGHTEPIWEECSKQEYEKHVHPPPSVWTDEEFIIASKELCSKHGYKREPIFENNSGGLLFQIEQHVPIDYKYYKRTGSRFVLSLGREMFDYCQTRECMKHYFSEICREEQ